MNKIFTLLCCLTALFGFGTAFGQTTISNAPSTDVNEAQTTYVEGGFGAHFGKYADGGYQSYSLRVLYGLRRNVEVGANLTYTRDGALSPVEFSPNVKWKVYYNENFKLTVAGGAIAFVPVRDEKGTRPSGMAYAVASKEFGFVKGARFTGGFYSTVAAKRADGNRTGVIVGYEQLLFKKVNLLADYVSGNNRFGYTGIGISLPIAKKNVLYAGYSFGNAGRGNNGLAVTFGRYF